MTGKHDDFRVGSGDTATAASASASRDPGEETKKKTPTTPPGWAVDLSCGVVAGAAYTVVAHPFDTVKVAMQSRANDLPPIGTMDTVRSIVSGKRGALSLFKGLSAPLVGYSLECGVNYASFSQCRAWLEKNGRRFGFCDWKAYETAVSTRATDSVSTEETDSATTTATAVTPEPEATARDASSSENRMASRLAQVALAGGVGGFLLSGIVSPTDLIKCRVQDGQFGGPRGAIVDIYKKGGLSGFGKGLGATLLREVPGNALFFTTYEVTQLVFPRWTQASRGTSSATSAYWVQETAAAVTCGGASGCVFWLTMLPVDYAKTRLQIAKPGSADDQSVFRIMARTFRTKGITGLYAGAWPTLLRAFPANAAQFLAWEMATQAMGSRRAVSGID